MKRLGSLCAVGVLSTSLSVNAVASCDSSIRNTNILTTSLLTVVNHWFNKGSQFTLRDAARSFVYGSVGGYGFYKAKQYAGRGNVAGGVALAYLSSSVVENVVNDEHPLSYIRYGVGPAEFRVSTPLAKNASAMVAVEFDPVEAVQMMISSGNVDKWDFKDGIVYGVSDSNLESDDLPVVYAQATGRHVVFDKDHVFYETTWEHEAVHVIQNIQYQSFFGIRYSDVAKKFKSRGPSAVGHDGVSGALNWIDADMRVGWFHVPFALFSDSGGYEERWDEFEAAHMGDGRAPFGSDDAENCAAGMSFSLDF